jgi:hypothetical protein
MGVLRPLQAELLLTNAWSNGVRFSSHTGHEEPGPPLASAEPPLNILGSLKQGSPQALTCTIIPDRGICCTRWQP